MNRGVDSVLGKNTTNYTATYDPGILAQETRLANRTPIGIPSNTDLPFDGFDSWHAYETTFLTLNGLPVCGVTKIVIPITSEYLVESKSLKLYLFSFSNMRIGDGSIASAIQSFQETVQRDVSAIVGAPIEVEFHEEYLYTTQQDSNALPGNEAYENLGGLVEDQTGKLLALITFDTFEEDPSLLVSTETGLNAFRVYTSTLRSNCKITNQPDYGTVYIQYKGDALVDLEGLLKYIVSFRNESHFHEEITETIFVRMKEAFNPDELMVTTLYTRRGGIDICPARATDALLLPRGLGDVTVPDVKDWRQ